MIGLPLVLASFVGLTGDTATVNARAAALGGVDAPVAVVAAQVRAVLYAGDDRDAWSGLASVLPDLALTGHADLEATLEATRVADSVVASVGAGSLLAETAGRVSTASIGLPFRVRPSDFASALAGLVALIVIWRSTRTTAPRGNAPVRSSGSPASTSSKAAAPPPRTPSRASSTLTRPTVASVSRASGRELRSLFERGLTAAEIARATGLPQDAVRAVVGGAR